MRGRRRQVMVPLVMSGFLLLFISSGILFSRGKDTLSGLLSRASASRTTFFYSRWRDVYPQASMTLDYALQMLKQTGYEEVAVAPEKPGHYSYHAPFLSVFTRDFVYPDRTLPAQCVTIRFSGNRIERVEGSALLQGGAWRLEPKVIRALDSKETALRPRVTLTQLPPYVPLAIVAVEDKRFYRHGALDILGVGRAAFVDLEHGHLRQGASTISQQLARSIFLTARRTWSRKVMEAIFAFYLEARFSKAQLLEMYLNQVYWGQEGSESLLGIEAASRSYVGHSARELSLGEAAMLAGLLQSPNHFSPRAFPTVALARRNLVLSLMFDQHLISEADYAQALAQPLTVVPVVGEKNDAAYFLGTLQDGLEQKYGLTHLDNLGWRIFTTLDPVLQPLAEAVLSRRTTVPSEPQDALVAIDPASGAVLSWVGGTNYQASAYDRAALAHRQPGSAFKPFVFLAALDEKKVTTATLLSDKPLVLKGTTGRWVPQNYDRKYRDKASVWDSLVLSLNIPAVNLAMQIGLGEVADYARRAGIQSVLHLVPSLALGTSEVTLPELTNAYATLAARGVYHPAYSVEAILDFEGHALENHRDAAQPVFDPSSVYLITQMLQAVFQEGTAKAVKDVGFTARAAGKTGTSENYQDAWFMGYTTNLACGVWVGHDKPKSLGHSAAATALPLWTAFMKKATDVMPPEPFEPAPHLVWETVDADTGLLARSGCQKRRYVAFLEGTAPTQSCSAHPGGLFGFFYRLRH